MSLYEESVNLRIELAKKTAELRFRISQHITCPIPRTIMMDKQYDRYIPHAVPNSRIRGALLRDYKHHRCVSGILL